MAETKSTAKQTVRERSQASATKPKNRRIQQTANTVTKPVKAVRKGVRAVAKPLKPMARPFKTKPMKKIGRFLSKVLLINYLRGSWHELKQVTWPDRKTTFKLTIAVFIFAIVFGAIIAAADYGLDKLFQKILLS